MKGKFDKQTRHNNHPHNPIMHLTMLALLSHPETDKHLDQAISLIEGISNTIRTLRRGMDSLHTGIKEAQQQMLRLPYGHTNIPNQLTNNQPYSKFPGNENINTLPAKEKDEDNNR
ncbi:hypothetical protein JOC37_000525 [Desulfohalotomaculum tongense]|uniref:hypothetical protein n=1 Tax=Desulforadius tongensis TaxID=1216062 RepID=UPI00195EB87E|nr:hypothetical protein [Desulforadius tongensis]MBM7854153.1 hypothetical protein [Desulforadius tongensis]